jgi:hypothetical protein
MDKFEEQFRKQFDPNDPSYHGSKDKRPIVPYSGANKVPSSMPSEYPESSQPDINVESYGPEYERIFSLRESLSELKKKIVAITSPIEALIRLRSNSAPNEKIEKELSKKEDAIQSLLIMKDVFTNTEMREKTLVIETIVEGAGKDYNSVEDFFQFSVLCKRESQKIFNEQKQLLEILKKIKKQYMCTQ